MSRVNIRLGVIVIKIEYSATEIINMAKNLHKDFADIPFYEFLSRFNSFLYEATYFSNYSVCVLQESEITYPYNTNDYCQDMLSDAYDLDGKFKYIDNKDYENKVINSKQDYLVLIESHQPPANDFDVDEIPF